MTKKEKIEQILKKVNQHLPDLTLARERIWTKLFNETGLAVTNIEEGRYNISKRIFLLKLYKAATLAIIIFFSLFILGSGISYAADYSAPGDFLYPLDRQLEKWQIALNKDAEKINYLKIRFLGERTKELQKIRQTQKGKDLAERERALVAEINKSYNDRVAELSKDVMAKNRSSIKEIGQLERKINILEEVRENLKDQKALNNNKIPIKTNPQPEREINKLEEARGNLNNRGLQIKVKQ